MERAQLTQFLIRMGCAEVHGGYVFLRDPHWNEAERTAAATLFAQASSLPNPANGWLCIRTGGSGGGIKFARHDEHTLSAAVEGFVRHFALAKVNAAGVLPPWHVSGLMARLRCVASGGFHLDVEWKALARGDRPALPASGDWVLSLVPTQLQRLLASPAAIEWLKGFRLIFLGGGPTWTELADAAAEHRLNISLSYGMTETAAMITAQQPAEFLAGDRSSGAPLSHASVALDDAGRVLIGGESLFRGYFPHSRSEPRFATQDLGRLDERGRLHLLGRADAVIISGGKKIHAIEVEAALRASGEFDDVVVLGVRDVEWGEIVVACYPATGRSPDLARAVAALAAHQRPKRFVAVGKWPRNAQGKINRAALAAALEPAR